LRYVQCLVCGKLTPVDRGVCYHCSAPLPSRIEIPAGTVICPNCLKVTTVETGYCRHCRAPLPPEIVEEALRSRKDDSRLALRQKRQRLRPGEPLGSPLLPGPL